MEKFREPHLWLQARENYSKSVAVTSMGMFIMYLVFLGFPSLSSQIRNRGELVGPTIKHELAPLTSPDL